MEENQRYISHYGVPGMRWGRSGVTKSMAGLEKSWNRSAQKHDEKAGKFREKAKLATHPVNKSIIESKAKREAATAGATRNIKAGITQAKKMVEGMNMRQAVKKMQNEAGYSKGLQIYTALTMGGETRLTLASLDYALNVTGSGEHKPGK